MFAHPQTLEGVQLAIDGGVDVLAHTAPAGRSVAAGEVASMVERA